MPLPTFSAGNRLKASDLTALGLAIAPTVAYKSADQSVVSSTTFVNVSSLVVAVTAGNTYLITGAVISQGPGSTTTGNLALRWTFPSGTLSVAGLGMEPAALTSTGKAEGTGEWLAQSAVSSSPSASISYAAGTNTLSIPIRVIFVASGSGSLQLQMAQNASNATNTTVKAGSHLISQYI